MNNYTKEYIELAKDKRIQGLRPELIYGDWHLFGKYQPANIQIATAGEVALSRRIVVRKEIVWLPQSHDLDEEIIKICNPHLWLYKIVYGLGDHEVEFDWSLEVYAADGLSYKTYFTITNTNPLIAKIKLLLQLIKE